MGLGWFGLSTLWLLPLVWQTVGRVLAGERRLLGRGSLRVLLGTVLVLGASATLESLTGGEGETAGGAVGHALAGVASGVLGWTGALLMMLAVLVIAMALFVVATPLANALGRTGVMVVTRLLGMLLAALSVQFVIDGLKGSGLFP